MYYDGHYTFNYDELKDIEWKFITGKHNSKTCDNIMCLDTEGSSGFYDRATKKVHEFSQKKYNKKKKVIKYYRQPNGKIVEVVEYQYKNKRYRHMMDKVWLPVSITYLWQYSIESATGEIKVFLGRTVEQYFEFRQKLSQIIRMNANCSLKVPVYAYTFCHNLSYEFNSFLMNVTEKFSDVFLNGKGFSVFARDKRKPIYASIKNCGVYWKYRCSYFLTNLSLKQWAINENLPVMKEKPIDYLRILTPANELDEETLRYSITDVVVMQYGLEKYRQQYGTLRDIPNTSTGKIRRALEKKALMNPDYAQLCYELSTSYDFEFFNKLINVYSGGWTHGNKKFVNRHCRSYQDRNLMDWMDFETLAEIGEYQLGGIDLASSYPACICIYSGFPMSKFEKWDVSKLSILEQEDPEHPKHAWFMKVRLREVQSKLNNSFWSVSKCLNEKQINDDGEARIDNGRIQYVSCMSTYMTNLDWFVFRQAYEATIEEVEELYVADAGRLPKPFVEEVLHAYANKTSLKGLGDTPEEKCKYESLYKKSKELANGVFGLASFKQISTIIDFKDNRWLEPWFPTSENGGEQLFYDDLEKVDDKTCHCAYQWGIWIAACARDLRLWAAILAMDDVMIYSDTDSVKAFFRPQDIEWVEKFNQFIKDESLKAASHFGFDPDLYSPKTKKGVPKPLGVFAIDSDDIDPAFIDPERPYEIYKSIKALGAKRYMTETVDGKFHITVAGLPKSAGPKMCKTVDDFNDHTKWTPDIADKVIVSYGEMPEIEWTGWGGVKYTNDDKFFVNMKPTGFDMSIAPRFKAFLDYINGDIDEDYVSINNVMLFGEKKARQ